ncbi:hypothetical protein PIB30_049113 [Stylosanthes scabra]|uniref:Uncharacterized protein n=1 Tax=Stylosanthes scabra TaxID=79078 RepID=A0ABU6TJF7_9FABA|nr:hypothetical protein [Stylosanthes scabra]
MGVPSSPTTLVTSRRFQSHHHHCLRVTSAAVLSTHRRHLPPFIEATVPAVVKLAGALTESPLPSDFGLYCRWNKLTGCCPVLSRVGVGVKLLPLELTVGALETR